MKNLKLLKAIGLAEDRYIEEADPSKKKAPLLITKKMITAACLCLITVGIALWLFIPHKEYIRDVSAYSDSEYYSVIQKLNAFCVKKPRYANNFMMIFENLSMSFLNMKSEGTADAAPNSSASQEYHEVTDNQVEGVIEGDRIKRSDKYIYYLTQEKLFVYEIGTEDGEPIKSLNLSGYENIEFFLSKDCTKITLIREYFSEGYSIVRVTLIDVSDPASPSIEKNFDVRGSYISSRVIDGKLILTTQFNVRANPDYSDEKNFVPQYDLCDGKGYQSIAADSIVAPNKLDSSNYTVLFMLDDHSLSLTDSSAFLSYSEELYVSYNYIYLSRGYAEKQTSGDVEDMSDISALSYTSASFSFKNTYCKLY